VNKRVRVPRSLIVVLLIRFVVGRIYVVDMLWHVAITMVSFHVVVKVVRSGIMLPRIQVMRYYMESGISIEMIKEDTVVTVVTFRFRTKLQ
jgi:hypothetical protein